MWTPQIIKWDNSHTDLTKFFIERIKQRVDFEESISNRHRTTCGYTLVHEIIEVATLTEKRIKSVSRLISIIEECIDDNVTSSISNDYIIQKYHSDIIAYYKNLVSKSIKDSPQVLKKLILESKIHLIRLNEHYYNNIVSELRLVNFSSSHFDTHAKHIDNILDSFIPYLFHQGYSATSISDVAYRLIERKKAQNSPFRFVKILNCKPKKYAFILYCKKNSKEIEEVFRFLDNKNIHFRKINRDKISNFLHEDMLTINEEENDIFYVANTTIDPHNYIRNMYEFGLKNYVLTKDRQSLIFFTDFFERVLWRDIDQNANFKKSNILLDPINVPKRRSTLFLTLECLNECHNLNLPIDQIDQSIPIINEIRDSVYYYNLALGSKSIENSLLLLWTSLETLLPYRMKENDIESVQYFVSKSLCIGSFGREIESFRRRMYKSNRINGTNLGMLNNWETSNTDYSTEKFIEFFRWLQIDYSLPENQSIDPYTKLSKNSTLLSKKFLDLNVLISSLNKDNGIKKFLKSKIESSELSIKYQLDRIYLHRNQIVHSGKFINEYSNLWNHLEWYVGKLLSFFFIKSIESNSQLLEKETVYMELESDLNFIMNFINSEKKTEITDDFLKVLLKNTWQFF